MVLSEKARVIGAEELKEIIEEDMDNPTIARLMFIEAQAKDGSGSRIFPCYVEAWGEDDQKGLKVDPGLRFLVSLTQYMNGEFGMVKVVVYAKDLGETKRIWDKPPTKGLREYIPWAAVEKGEQ